ncbi:MAG: hypothetical protein ACKOEC_18980, partial [Acidimicrobiia bacterium]
MVQTFSAGGSLSGSREVEGPSQVVSANGSGKYGTSSYQASDWNYYISALISAGAMTSGNANQIQIAGYFNGAKDANNIYHNAGYYSYRVTAAGSDITLTPDSTSQIKGAITLSINDLANSIYATNGSATIAGMTGSLTSSTINTGANNQWGAVLRDFATAFTGGYYGRLGSSLNPAVSGTINLNKEWNWDPTYAFQNNTTGTITASSGLSYNLYDPYAKVFFDNTDSYGAGYSDNLMNALTVGPLVSLASWPGVAANSQDITVTLFGDNEAPTGYTKPAIYNYISATSYLAPEQFTGDGLNVKLFFNNGSMSLKEGTPVTLKFMSGSSAFSSVTVSSFSNFNIVSSGGGYTVSSFGSQVYGNILFNQFPISVDSSGSGVIWYQIEVGSGVAAKTFNVYLTASGTSGSSGSRQFLNPDYVTSGGFIQKGAVAADGLATILGNGNASAALTGNLTIDFA